MPRFPCHVFQDIDHRLKILKIWSDRSRVSRHAPFWKMFVFLFVWYSKIFPNDDLWFSLNEIEYLGGSKVDNNGLLAVLGISTSPGNHSNKNISVFQKVRIIIYECVLNKNICAELMGFLHFFKVSLKMDRQTPLTPPPTDRYLSKTG